MNLRTAQITASTGLFIGGIFGMLGSVVPSAPLRSLAWCIDGIGLILAGALLTIYYFRMGMDMTACGFLIFIIGEGFILSSSGINLNEHITSFATGTSLWAVSLCIISLQKTYPVFIRCTGLLAAVLFSVVSVLIFAGNPLNAITSPFPFFAYPIFVITIFGWAWTLIKKQPPNYSHFQ